MKAVCRLSIVAVASVALLAGCKNLLRNKDSPDRIYVLNASPVGMRAGDGLPGDIGALDAGTLVGDVVVSETPTPLIALAQRQGCSWVSGRDMHSGQIDAIMGFFGALPVAAGGKASA